VLFLSLAAAAATRPAYGGILRAELQAAPATIVESPPEMSRLVFETITRIDDSGRVQPALAVLWKNGPDNRRWFISMRDKVFFHDGSPMNAGAVAVALNQANPSWKIRYATDTIVIELPQPNPFLPAELALPHNFITHKSDDGQPVGTGPFRLSELVPGKRALLVANDDYWAGRPYLDRVDVVLGRSLRDQAIDLDLGRADIIETAPDVRRNGTEHARTVSSAPIELVALVMAQGSAAIADANLRAAIASSIDRAGLVNLVTQKQGEPSATLLPNWMTGYAFLFPVAQDLSRARQLRSQLRQVAPVKLTYEAGDQIARLVSERVALNARDAGVTVQAVPMPVPGGADARIVRVRPESLYAPLALQGIATALGADAPELASGKTEDLYRAERSLLNDNWIVPLFQLPDMCAVGNGVRNWVSGRTGEWRLADVWKESEKP
jgi:ABC-type transport system substrate-binding protein